MAGLYLANTDSNWFDFLASQPALDEVNFWQPGGKLRFRALQSGEFLLFKLKAPRNKIGGYGTFVSSSLLPLSTAWDYFGIKNGHATLSEFQRAVLKYAPEPTNKTIGFRIIAYPVFWPRELWIDLPSDYAPQTQQGKLYDLESMEGRRLLAAIGERPAPPRAGLSEPAAVLFGTPHLVKPRLGQGAFRTGVMDAYEKRCIISGERTIPALDAAHIVPVAEAGNHELANGLLFRKDIHALFDKHYVTVTPQRRFLVSRRIKEEFENGRDYYALDGKLVREPTDIGAQPIVSALVRHNELFELAERMR